MAKVVIKPVPDSSESSLVFWCPACKCGHSYQLPRWNFDGNFDKPTISPSLLLFYDRPKTPEKEAKRVTICHLTITNGVIEYHSDCPHTMVGLFIDLPEIPKDYGV